MFGYSVFFTQGRFGMIIDVLCLTVHIHIRIRNRTPKLSDSCFRVWFMVFDNNTHDIGTWNISAAQRNQRQIKYIYNFIFNHRYFIHDTIFSQRSHLMVNTDTLNNPVCICAAKHSSHQKFTCSPLIQRQ